MDVSSALTMKQNLKILQMNPAKRRRLLKILARSVIKKSRNRLKEQKDIEGRKWAERKNQKNKKKMLRKLGKGMSATVNTKSAKVGFKNPIVGRIAKAQQDGISEVMTREKMQKKYGSPDYAASATRTQAKALRNEGYKIRRKNGKGWKSPTLKWIVSHLTLGQAGLVLRIMRDEPSKKSWVIPLPSRPFMGVSEKEKNTMIQTIFDQTARA